MGVTTVEAPVFVSQELVCEADMADQTHVLCKKAK
jgi:hypothetical protein